MPDEKKKPGLAEVMAKKPASVDMGSETEDDGDYSAVIGELFDAMKSDDRAGFEEAFKAAVMSCK